jgi:hypothetical protein
LSGLVCWDVCVYCQRRRVCISYVETCACSRGGQHHNPLHSGFCSCTVTIRALLYCSGVQNLSGLEGLTLWFETCRWQKCVFATASLQVCKSCIHAAKAQAVVPCCGRCSCGLCNLSCGLVDLARASCVLWWGSLRKIQGRAQCMSHLLMSQTCTPMTRLKPPLATTLDNSACKPFSCKLTTAHKASCRAASQHTRPSKLCQPFQLHRLLPVVHTALLSPQHWLYVA